MVHWFKLDPRRHSCSISQYFDKSPGLNLEDSFWWEGEEEWLMANKKICKHHFVELCFIRSIILLFPLCTVGSHWLNFDSLPTMEYVLFSWHVYPYKKNLKIFSASQEISVDFSKKKKNGFFNANYKALNNWIQPVLDLNGSFFSRFFNEIFS